MKYVYLESGINIVRVPKEEYESKNIKSVEVLVFDNIDHYHFEYNDIAQSIYESENLKVFDAYDNPEETEVYQKFILPLIGANKCKGLEAIQEYKRVTCLNCQYKDKENCNVVCFSNIIEKELKEYEQLKEMYNHALEVHSKLSESIMNYKKEHKALEIIRELHLFRFYDNNEVTATGLGFKLNQEEYDLLKEVL